jgi:hypothetical protein
MQSSNTSTLLLELPVKTSKGRWLTLAALLIVLMVAGIQLANPHSYLSEAAARIGEVGSGPDAALTDIYSIDQLKADFNSGAGHPRLILLLSPT